MELNILGIYLIGMLIVLSLAIIAGIVFIIIKAIKAKSTGSRMVLLSIFPALVIQALSWIFNIGWMRFGLTFSGYPFIHAVLFIIASIIASPCWDKSKKIRVMNVLFFVSYIMTYIFLPDVSDDGTWYFLFFSVRSNWLSLIAGVIASVSATGNFVLFILQLVGIRELKSEESRRARVIHTENSIEE